MRVCDLMHSDVVTVASTYSIAAAQQRMFDRGVKHLPVVDDGHLVGLLTERDLLRGLMHIRLAPTEVQVAEVMTDALMTVDPDASIEEAIGTMASHHFGCLPVVRDGVLVGIVTATDVLQLAQSLAAAAAAFADT